MEVGTSETSHSQNKPGLRIDNLQTVIINTEPTSQPSIFLIFFLFQHLFPTML